MSREHRPARPVFLSGSQLRSIIERALITDAELDAFCLDYAPDIHRQFSAGMERTRKLNLLLFGTDASDLLESLRHRAPELVNRELEKPSPQILQTKQRPSWRVRWLALVLVPVVFLSLFLHRLFPRTPPKTGEVREQVRPLPTEQAVAVSGSLESPRLTSEPTEALVYAVPSGKLLGKTPWTPDPGFNRTEVCVRSPGFLPALVKLGPRSEPSWFRSVRVRLQQPSRAGPERDSSEEICHVPTPLPD